MIANGCECEPLVFSDRHLLARHACEIAAGLELAMQTTGAGRGILAFVNGAPALEEAVRAAVKSSRIEIFQSPEFYPAMLEPLLTYEATGRVVPSAGSPESVGVLVLNVETLFNLSLAMAGRPVTHRSVTVAGEVAEPKVVRLPLGAPLSDAIQCAGGATIERYRVLVGGPISGRLADATTEPITKTTSAVIVLPMQHIQVQKRMRSLSMMLLRARSVCFECQDCTESCPLHLLGQAIEPHKIMRAISHSLDSLNTSITSAVNCGECGVCESFVCKMGISPRLICHEIKAHLAAMGWEKASDVRTARVLENWEEKRIPIDALVERLGVAKYFRALDIPKLLETGGEQQDETFGNLMIPLLQHIGVPALPVVHSGDAVQAGQMIGEIPDGKLAARVHTGLSGTVGSVGTCSVEINGSPESAAQLNAQPGASYVNLPSC